MPAQPDKAAVAAVRSTDGGDGTALLEPKIPLLSIVIPTLNEAQSLPELLAALKRQLQTECQNGHVEIIVADGHSEDDTGRIAQTNGAHVVLSERGRARQMNAGAFVSRGSLIAFLHADTIPEQACLRTLLNLARSSRPVWGHFSVRLSGDRLIFRIIERLINLRSGISSIATGDQLMFVSRCLFEEVGRFPDITLMEDVALSCRLKARQRAMCRPERVLTSSRRWDERGIFSTIFLMWRLRWAYFRGVDPCLLHAKYYGRD